MLKVTTLVIAASAALGMSSAGAQTSPGGSRSGWSYYTHPDGTTRVYAGGSPVGGFQATPNANTTKFTYNPPSSSPAPVVPNSPSAGNYTTIKRMGDGFTLEQRANLPVPGRDITHPVALRKPITHASMAKAFAKTLPILGNALALKELFDEIFEDPTYWNSSSDRWEFSRSTDPVWKWYYRDATGTIYTWFTSPSAACASRWPATSSPPGTWSNEAGYPNPVPSAGQGLSCFVKYFRTTQSFGYEQSTEKVGDLPGSWRCSDNSEPTSGKCPVQITPITEPLLEEKLGSLFSFPPESDTLLPYIPEQARKDLAEENKGPGVSVIPYTPNGTPSFEPWVSPESISTTSTQASSEIKTTTKRTTTTATPVQDGVRYDTTTTTTTESQQLDPVTGLPDGPPTTETTTETTEQTPTKPAEGEDLECGLPGTPPCKIDETGTPGTDEANFDKGEEEIENFKSGLLAKVQEKLDEITHEWTWSFALPTGCAALQFDTQVGPVVQIDMCEWQPMIHDIMSMIWAAAGVFGAMMIFLRSNG